MPRAENRVSLQAQQADQTPGLGAALFQGRAGGPQKAEADRSTCRDMSLWPPLFLLPLGSDKGLGLEAPVELRPHAEG